MDSLWFVIPSYNSSNTINDTFSSIDLFINNFKLINNSWNLNILFTDDGSSDESKIMILKIIEESLLRNNTAYKIHFIDNKINIGTVSNLYNSYIKIRSLSRGKVYIKTIAADDVIIPEQMIKLLQYVEGKYLDLVISDIILEDLNGIMRYRSSISDFVIQTRFGRILLLKYHYVYSPSSLYDLDFVIKTTLIAKNIGLRLMEDWIIAIYAAYHNNVKVKTTDFYPVKYRINYSSVVKSLPIAYINDLEIQYLYNKDQFHKYYGKSKTIKFLSIIELHVYRYIYKSIQIILDFYRNLA